VLKPATKFCTTCSESTGKLLQETFSSMLMLLFFLDILKKYFKGQSLTFDSFYKSPKIFCTPLTQKFQSSSKNNINEHFRLPLLHRFGTGFLSRTQKSLISLLDYGAPC
jgi:hypothetical protein